MESLYEKFKQMLIWLLNNNDFVEIKVLYEIEPFFISTVTTKHGKNKPKEFPEILLQKERNY